MDDFLSVLNMDSEGLSPEEKYTLKEHIIAFIQKNPNCLEKKELKLFDFPMFQVAVLLEYKVGNPSFFVPLSVLVDGLYDLRETPFSPYCVRAVQTVIEHTQEGRRLSSSDRDRLRNITTLLAENAIKEDCLELLPCLYKLWQYDKKTEKPPEFFDMWENSSSKLKRAFQQYCYKQDPHSALSQQSLMLVKALDFKLFLNEEKTLPPAFLQKFLEEVSSIHQNHPNSPQSLFLKQEMVSWVEKLVCSPLAFHNFFTQVEKLPLSSSQTLKKMLAEACTHNPMLLFHSPTDNNPAEFLCILDEAMSDDQRSVVLSKMVSNLLFYPQEIIRQRVKQLLKVLAKNPKWCKNITCSSSHFWNNVDSVWSLMSGNQAQKHRRSEFPQLAEVVKNFHPSFTTFLFIVQEVEKIPAFIDKNDCSTLLIPEQPFDVQIISNTEKIDQILYIAQSINDYVALKNASLPQKKPSLSKKM